MFAPNRLVTTKEQWLLVGVIVAILTGCATLYFYDNSQRSDSTEGTTIISVKQQPTTSQPVKPQPIPQKPAVNTASTPISPAPAPSTPQQGNPVETPSVPNIIGVAIMGAVAHPDLYMVEEGVRVADLIALAGGTTEQADLSDVLLTAPLVDETTLTIPALPTVTRDETQVAMRRRDTSSNSNPPMYRRSATILPAHRPPAGMQEPPSHVPASAPPPDTAASGGLLNINHATSEQLQKLPGIGPVFAERIIEERNRQPFMSVDEIKRVAGIADKRLEAIRPFVTAP